MIGLFMIYMLCGIPNILSLAEGCAYVGNIHQVFVSEQLDNDGLAIDYGAKVCLSSLPLTFV